jgi:tetratricopeptide (TPR) repeat protein
MLSFMTDSATNDAAIQEALRQNWTEAIRLNKLILAQNPESIDALNRLGFAYLNVGKMKDAKQTFEKVLKLDPYNRIASNNLKKILHRKGHEDKTKESSPLSPMLFLEEPGKTKCVDCINVASQPVIAGLSAGQEVVFKFKKHSVDVRTMGGTYIGALPDDLAFRLIKYTNGGNGYSVHIKGITKSCFSLFIREIKRGKRYKDQASFSGSTSYMPYSHDPQEKKTEEVEE